MRGDGEVVGEAWALLRTFDFILVVLGSQGRILSRRGAESALV